MTHGIQADGLVKCFGDTTALAGIDLTVPPGTVLGLLGPNGAGKTTAVRILATLLTPDEGRATVGGYDVVEQAHQVRQLIGLTGQYASVDETLTGTENLVVIARLLGIPRDQAKARARDLLREFRLDDAADRAAKTYSGGMRRRLDLAASLVGNPRILFLDEPTTGLDPVARLDMWDLVRLLVADGVTVLLTTQYLDEADELCDDLVVIDHGKVIATGSPDQLKSQVGAQSLVVRPARTEHLEMVMAVVRDLAKVDPEVQGQRVTAAVSDPALVPAVVRRLDDEGVVLDELTLRGASLDEVFLTLTGHHAEEPDDEREQGSVVSMTTTDISPARGSTRPTQAPPQDIKPRVTPAEGLQQTLTLAWRTLIQIRHNPWELGDFSIQPIIFVLLFTYVFGGAIADSPSEYLQYAMPGIIVMNMFFVTMYVGQGLNTDITKGVFDRLRSLPIARWAPLSGRILADMVKQAWSIVLLLVVGFILGFRLGTSVAGLAAAFLLIMFFALCFSWVTVLVGVLADDPEKVQLFGFTVLFPVTFLSAVFVPIDTMPGWLQPVVKANPVTILSDAARGLMVEGPVTRPVILSLIWAVAIAAVFAPLSVRALRRRV